MDKEAGEHRDAVPAQLLSQRARVLHVQDLSCHQEDDPKREVPERTEEPADHLLQSKHARLS